MENMRTGSPAVLAEALRAAQAELGSDDTELREIAHALEGAGFLAEGTTAELAFTEKPADPLLELPKD